MVIKVKTKHEIRQELNQAIDAFLQQGGEVNHIERGISGKTIGENIDTLFSGEKTPAQTRTLLTDTIKTLDERKHPPSKQRPRKKIIYDDFGEPLREIWE